MHRPLILLGMVFAILLPRLAHAGVSGPPQDKKDYLSEIEADKIRDAETPAERIKLFLTFAEDRLKKFQYELSRKTPDRRRAELLNSLMNAYAGCMDDAADQIAVAQERQADIREMLKLMQWKGNEFLDLLQNLDKNGRDLDIYKGTLEDAIDSTKEALSDVAKAQKEMLPPPVRRRS
jgi:hypothetical protein